MNSIVDIIRTFDGLLFLEAVSDEDIEKAESLLSVSFAPEYKKYTSTFGAVAYGGKEFTGVVQPPHLNVVTVTEAARKITPQASPDWYVVMDPHFDGIIIWQDKDGIIYQTDPDKETKKVAQSLAEYMLETSKEVKL